MKWQIHPARNSLAKTFISIVFIVLFLFLIARYYNVYWALLGLVFLFATLHSYYFPTTYEITDEEVIIKTIFSRQKRKLSEFRKAYSGKNGILLSPFRHKTFLNNFRGVFLLLPRERDEIIDFINKKLTAKAD